MISLIPYRKVILRTHLSLEEITARLRDNIVEGSPYRSYLFRKPPQPFRGEIAHDRFRIRRIIRYRNNFLPLVNGEVRDDLDRRVITLRMHPPLFTLAATAVIFLFVAGILVTTLADVTIGGNPTTSPLAVVGTPVFILGLFGGLMVVLFSIEANKATTLLREMFEVGEL